MKKVWAALVVAGCIGPQLVAKNDTGGTVWFYGKEGFGYVTADVMKDRTREAEALAHVTCDGGYKIEEHRAEGRDNYLDFVCAEPLPQTPGEPPAPPPGCCKKCPEYTKPCGDTCIPLESKCKRTTPGCAC